MSQRPDLVLIHRSAIFHSAALELDIAYGPFDDPEQESRFLRSYFVIESKLIAFLGYVCLGDSETKFLVSSSISPFSSAISAMVW